MENQIVSYLVGQAQIDLTPEIVKSVLVTGDPDAVTEQEVTLFIALCRYRHLNPFLKQAYLVKFKNSPAQIIVSQDVFIERAIKNKNCAGWREGIIVIDKSGAEVSRESSIVRSGEELIGAWCEVYRHDWSQPLRTEVALSEYKRYKADGQPMALWKTHPASQIVKVARSQGLRRAFVEDLGDLYDESENASITNIIDITPKKEPVTMPRSKSEATAEEQAQDLNETDSTEPICITCGGKVSAKSAEYCEKQGIAPTCYNCQQAAKKK